MSQSCFCGCGRPCRDPSAFLQIEIRSRRVGRYWPIPFARAKCRDRWWKRRREAEPLFQDGFLPTDRGIVLLLQHAEPEQKRGFFDRLLKRGYSATFRDVEGWAFETPEDLLSWWRSGEGGVRCERTATGLKLLDAAPEHWVLAADPDDPALSDTRA